MTETLRGNEIIVLPSLELTPQNMIPHLDIIEENLNRDARYKKDKESNADIYLTKKKLIDFSQIVNKISHDYMKEKGRSCKQSKSLLVKREIG